MLPVTVAVRTPTVFEHTVGELTDTFGFGLFARTPEPEPVQPFVSVTVTVYVPGTLTLIDAVVLLYPPGPVQLKLNGPAVLPLTIGISVATVFEHTVGELTVTFGLALTFNVPELDPTQPLVSVTVTLYVPGTLTLTEAEFENGPLPAGPDQL